jgi:hypothetical protein
LKRLCRVCRELKKNGSPEKLKWAKTGVQIKDWQYDHITLNEKWEFKKSCWRNESKNENSKTDF